MQLFNDLSWIHDFPDSNSLPATEMVTLDSGREIEYNAVRLLLGITENMWLESSSQKDVECRLAHKADDLIMLTAKTSKIYTGFMVCKAVVHAL